MNAKLQNIKGLFRDTRTRTIIIFTGIILFVAIIMGLVRWLDQPAGPASTAQVSGPGDIQSVPGGFDRPVTAEYAQLQEKQNQLQAQIAAKQGTSAMPTIIRSASFGQVGQSPIANPGCCNCCGPQVGAFPPKVASPLKPDTLVYDANGNVIGTVGPDGKVRNADGLVIGTVGQDGLVRDANGNIIGAAGITPAGTPVYDAEGKLIGKVGADGKVRDANGNIIGTVGPDGLVRDANGNVIGKAGTPTGKTAIVPRTPVYDSNGRLIGVVGEDGKIQDPNGNVIGTVGPDGVVRDANGNVIGKVGPTRPGSPAYDAQGRLIGIVGPDGKVRDADGRVIGTVGIDGVVRDAQGNPIGSINTGTTTVAGAPPSSAAAGTGVVAGASVLPGANEQSAQLQAIMQRQAALVSTQRAEQLRNQIQGAMTGQANQLLTAWGPPTQAYVVGIPPANAAGAYSSGMGGAGSSSKAAPAVKAGTIMFAVLMTAINSDEPGPILATIVDGKFKGGRLLGSIQYQGQTVALNFNALTLPDIPSSIPINAVAIDENTARTAFSSRTDNHYLLRYGSLFASSFIEGYGQAYLSSGSTITNSTTSTQQTSPDLNPRGKFAVALGNVGNRYGSVVGNLFNTPPTVYVNSGTAMGILFLSDLAALPTG